MLGKDKLVLDTANLTESDNVGAYLRASDGSLIAHTANALHVAVQGTVTVTATDFDIRDLTHVSDSIKVGDGTDFLAVNADGSVNVQVPYDYAEDSVHVSGEVGAFVLGVRQDADTSPVSSDGDYHPFIFNDTGRLKVEANFDTAFDFVYPEDSGHTTGDPGAFILAVRNDANAVLTSADLDYSAIAVDSAGRVKIVGTVTANAEKAEDSAHVSGDIGNYVLAVQQATLASSVSADGDYASFKLNDRGALWSVPVGTVADDAVDTENPVKVGSRARIGALLAISTNGDRADALSDRYRRIYVNNGPNISALNSVATVTTTAANLLTTQLSGRRRYLIQNLGALAIYLGNDATVTTSTGFKMASGSNMDVELGEDVSLFAIAAAGSQNVRILELA